MAKERGYGEGHITKRIVNGIEYYRFVKRVGKNNKKRMEVTGRSEREVVIKMNKKERAYLEKEVLGEAVEEKNGSSSDALLKDAIYHWIHTFKRDLKPRSLDTLDGIYRNYVKDTKLGQTVISNVTTDDIQQYLNSVYDDKSYSTAKKVYELYHAFFDHYYIKQPNRNPMLGTTKPKKPSKVLMNEKGVVRVTQADVMSDEEIQRFTKEVESGINSNGYELLFILWTFIRLGEAQALEFRDIDMEEHTLTVRRANSRIKVYDEDDPDAWEWEWHTDAPKSESGFREVHICDEGMKALEEHLKLLKTERKAALGDAGEITSETRLFSTLYGNPQSGQYLNDLLKKFLKRAGINKKISVHGLRHTGISYFLRHGADIKVVSEQAGHSEVSITYDVYYNIIKEQRKELLKTQNTQVTQDK